MTEKSFYVQVVKYDGDTAGDIWEDEIKEPVSEEELKVLKTLPIGQGELFNTDELSDLYRRLEEKAFEKEQQRFFDKYPDAEDDGFEDYQIFIDV